jgi:hypothetical protein
MAQRHDGHGGRAAPAAALLQPLQQRPGGDHDHGGPDQGAEEGLQHPERTDDQQQQAEDGQGGSGQVAADVGHAGPR